MIKPNEIRIGNVFQEGDSKVIITVEEITKRNITFSGVFYNAWQAEPIPITEEWLLNMGYDKVGIDFMNRSRYSLYKPVEYVGYLFCEGNLILREIKSVHQLQNLYFALTGEELTIK